MDFGYSRIEGDSTKCDIQSPFPSAFEISRNKAFVLIRIRHIRVAVVLSEVSEHFLAFSRHSHIVTLGAIFLFWNFFGSSGHE